MVSEMGPRDCSEIASGVFQITCMGVFLSILVGLGVLRVNVG